LGPLSSASASRNPSPSTLVQPMRSRARQRLLQRCAPDRSLEVHPELRGGSEVHREAERGGRLYSRVTWNATRQPAQQAQQAVWQCFRIVLVFLARDERPFQAVLPRAAIRERICYLRDAVGELGISRVPSGRGGFDAASANLRAKCAGGHGAKVHKRRTFRGVARRPIAGLQVRGGESMHSYWRNAGGRRRKRPSRAHHCGGRSPITGHRGSASGWQFPARVVNEILT
jgi:hypothetical protein